MNESEIKALLKQKTANKVGRPDKYTKALDQEICERISAGESLLSIVQDDHMPDYRSVMRWRDKYTKFRQNYTHARAKQAESWADMLMEIAMTEKDVNRARLMSDNAKWTASKLLPKVYGDRVDVNQEINVSFNNGLPRPKVVDANATYSVPPKTVPSKTTKQQG